MFLSCYEDHTDIVDKNHTVVLHTCTNRWSFYYLFSRFVLIETFLWHMNIAIFLFCYFLFTASSDRLGNRRILFSKTWISTSAWYVALQSPWIDSRLFEAGLRNWHVGLCVHSRWLPFSLHAILQSNISWSPADQHLSLLGYTGVVALHW